MKLLFVYLFCLPLILSCGPDADLHLFTISAYNMYLFFDGTDDGWEYDCAVNELHKNKPEGVEDIYTPDGILNPCLPDKNADIGNDHTMSAGYHPKLFRS